MEAVNPPRFRFTDSTLLIRPDASLDEALERWNDWKKQCYTSTYWVQLELLARLAKEANASIVHASGAPSRKSLWAMGTPSWTSGHLSIALVSEPVGSFFSAIMSEFRRFDSHFAKAFRGLFEDATSLSSRIQVHIASGEPFDDAYQHDWVRDAREICTQTGILALSAHAHQTAALWVLVGYGTCALDISAVLVSLEVLSFWNASFATILDPASEVLRIAGGVIVEAPPPPPATAAAAAAIDGGRKKDKEKKKKKEDKGKEGKKATKAKSVASISSPAAVLEEVVPKESSGRYIPSVLTRATPPLGARKPSHVVVALVKPSLEWAAKSEAIRTGKLVPCSPCTGGAASTRIYLDESKWNHYRQAIEAFDPFAVNAVGKSPFLYLRWDGAGQSVGACVVQASGEILEDLVSASDAQEILRGTVPEGLSTRKSFAAKDHEGKLHVTSQRTLFVSRKDREVVLTWDTNVVMSNVMNKPTASTAFAMSGWQIPQSAVLFPYQVATFTVYGDPATGVPDHIVELLRHPAFHVVPGFHEYLAGSAALHPDLHPQPPWMPELVSAWQDDWCAVFTSRFPADHLCWKEANVGGGKSSTDGTGGGKKKDRHRRGRNNALEDDSFDDLVSIQEVSDEVRATTPRGTERTPLLAPRPPTKGHQWANLFNRAPRADAANDNNDPDDDAQAGTAARKLEMRETSRRDPKTYWANERTLLSWLSAVIFLAISAVQLLTFGDRVPQIAGTVMGPIAMLTAMYALLRFHFRNVAITRGGDMGDGVVDRWGPWVFVPTFCAALVVLIVVSFVFGSSRIG